MYHKIAFLLFSSKFLMVKNIATAIAKTERILPNDKASPLKAMPYINGNSIPPNIVNIEYKPKLTVLNAFMLEYILKSATTEYKSAIKNENHSNSILNPLIKSMQNRPANEEYSEKRIAALRPSPFSS